jgi:magnesium transporter
MAPTTTLDDLVAAGDLERIDAWLTERGALDVADELVRLPPALRAVPFRLLAKDRALAVFEAMDPIHQRELLDALGEVDVDELFVGLDADDRARLLDEMPAKVANRLLAGLPEQARRNTNALLGYAEESVGRTMSPRYVNVGATMTAADALAKVRRAGLRSREVLVLPVTGGERRLVGVVDLPDLVTSDSATRVGDLMRPDTYSARVDEDQEVASRLMQEADLVALPVVDTENRLVGVLTVDDAMEILELEDTEDISRAGGVEPLQTPYLEAGVLLLARKRATWLLVLILAAVLTVNVLATFEDTLEQVLALSLFIPLLIDTGGNSGSQAATIVIRAMAVGEVRFADLPTILRRELAVGVLLGAMLGAIAVPIVTVFFGLDFAIVIGSTLVAICTAASFFGGMLPLVGKRLGLDPAVVSAPFITTLVDAGGLLLYFLIARAVLGL